MLNVGDKIVGVYGAMFPEEMGEVTKVNYDDTVTVLFDEGAVKTYEQDEIRTDYLAPAGSPIGIYLYDI